MRSNTVKLNKVTNATDLQLQIMKLNALKAEQEMLIKHDLKVLSYALQPATILKKTINNITHDNEIQQDALKTTLNIGSSFLLDKILFRKGAGIKAYILNAALKKVASYFIDKNKIRISGQPHS